MARAELVVDNGTPHTPLSHFPDSRKRWEGCSVAIKDLSSLLVGMEPESRGEYLFVAVPEEAFGGLLNRALAFFREAEGPTLVLPAATAAALPDGCKVSAPHTLVTLNVNSNLEAVGFLAAITTALAAEGISVNPISAYHHDHLLIPSHSIERAMAVLERLRKGRPSSTNSQT